MDLGLQRIRCLFHVAISRTGDPMSDAVRQVSAWLERFDAAVEESDMVAASEMFGEECFWRDLVSFTWNIVTVEGRNDIREMLSATIAGVQPGAWSVDEESCVEQDGVVEGWFNFETAVSRARGHLRLKRGRCWTLFTSMLELKGFEEKRGARRIQGAQHGFVKNRKSWVELKSQEEAELGYTRQPYCAIIGGGQGGIGLGARLKQLEVPTIIIEKNARAGDSWRKRYESLCLHDPVWYDHMPYLPFPDHWPVFTPKDKMGDWLEMYTKVMELNYWNSTRCEKAEYDEASEEWEVTVNREGEKVVLRVKQLVLATGMSGMPHVPEFRGTETFRGVQLHSSLFTTGEDYTGQRCVVVGTGNSGHDIAANLWEHDADVTIIQRSSALVVKSETLWEEDVDRLYSEAALRSGVTTEHADEIVNCTPYKLVPQFSIPIWKRIAERDAELYEGLVKAGFLLNFGEDASGIWLKYVRRGSGYYIDVGCSELIINGDIKLHSGVSIEKLREHSVILTDGTELAADLIVYATGYGSMNEWAAQLISQEVADKVGKCWGLGSGTTKDPGPYEGELRNMWKPTQQSGLWFHGGNLHQSRYYSRLLALQVKARMEGIRTPVYRLAESYHVS